MPTGAVNSRLNGVALAEGSDGVTRGWRMVYEPRATCPCLSKRGRTNGWAAVSTRRRAMPLGSCVSLSRVITKRTSVRRSASPTCPTASGCGGGLGGGVVGEQGKEQVVFSIRQVADLEALDRCGDLWRADQELGDDDQGAELV